MSARSRAELIGSDNHAHVRFRAHPTSYQIPHDAGLIASALLREYRTARDPLSHA